MVSDIASKNLLQSWSSATIINNLPHQYYAHQSQQQIYQNLNSNCNIKLLKKSVSPLPQNYYQHLSPNANFNIDSLETMDQKREKIYYHLSSLFPSESVLKAMALMPNEVDCYTICDAIIKMNSTTTQPTINQSYISIVNVNDEKNTL